MGRVVGHRTASLLRDGHGELEPLGERAHLDLERYTRGHGVVGQPVGARRAREQHLVDLPVRELVLDSDVGEQSARPSAPGHRRERPEIDRRHRVGPSASDVERQLDHHPVAQGDDEPVEPVRVHGVELADVPELLVEAELSVVLDEGDVRLPAPRL